MVIKSTVVKRRLGWSRAGGGSEILKKKGFQVSFWGDNNVLKLGKDTKNCCIAQFRWREYSCGLYFSQVAANLGDSSGVFSTQVNRYPTTWAPRGLHHVPTPHRASGLSCHPFILSFYFWDWVFSSCIGWLWIHSVVQKGFEFVILLPLPSMS